MVKNNILYFIISLVLIQLLKGVESKKCIVKQSKNSSNDNLIDNTTEGKDIPIQSGIVNTINIETIPADIEQFELETETVVIDGDISTPEDSLDSEIDSDDEMKTTEVFEPEITSISGKTQTITTYITKPTTVITRTTKATTTIATSPTTTSTTTTTSTSTTTTTTSTTTTTTSTTTTTTSTTTTTTSSTTTTTTTTTTTIISPTPDHKSCIKDDTVICGDFNTRCSVGMDELPAKIYGSEFIKITKSPEIINKIKSLQLKYGKDIHYSCKLTRFAPGVKDYKYRSNEMDDEFVKSFPKTETTIQVYGSIECEPEKLQKVDESEPDFEKNKEHYVRNEENEYDENLYWKLESTEKDRILSKVKIENYKLLSSNCLLNGENGHQGYYYLPITDSEVISYYNNPEGMEIKNRKYTLYSNTININRYRSLHVSLSGVIEKWLIKITVGDDVIYDC